MTGGSMRSKKRHAESKERYRHLSDRARAGILLALALCLAGAILLSLRFGSQDYSLGALWEAVCQRDPADAVWRILRYVRLPRTLGCIAAGGALAVAGVLMQGVLNNAMASPNVIGVNAGAAFFAMLAAAFLPGAAGTVQAASFLGALCTALFIYMLASRSGMSRTTLILCGVVVSSILTAGVNAISLFFPDSVIGASAFMLGGFSGVTLSSVSSAAVYIVPGLLLALFLSVDLNVLALGEESAAGLGLNVGRTRLLAVIASALLAGAAVSIAGLLNFVGLLVPHMLRPFMGNDNRWLIPSCALGGAAFVLLCDVFARILFAPFEVPVGIVMSLVGGPFFLWLLLHQRRVQVYD